MDTQELIEALKEVPERRLRIIELAWKVTKDGAVNPDLAAFYSEELEEAAREVESYVQETREAVECLRKLIHS